MIAIPLFALVLAAADPGVAAPPASSPPRHIDDLSKPLTGAVPQGGYEVGVQGAFARAENLQGPLDGAWVLSDGPSKLYRFQLDDPGYRGGPVQGAFQDLNAQGLLGASGFVDGVVREGTTLAFSFEARGSVANVSLEVRPGGTYAGKMTRAGVSREVTLARP